MSTSTQFFRWFALAVSLAGLFGSAQAQSSYTMSVLSKPSAVRSAAPFALDNAGNAYGGGSYLYKTTYAIGGVSSCWVCRVYRYQDVKWPASTAATVSGSLGIKDFLVTAASGDGAVLLGATGAYEDDATRLAPQLSPSGAPWFNALPSVSYAIKRSSTLTKLKQPSTYQYFAAKAINSAGVIAGQIYPRIESGISSDPKGAVLQNDSFTSLEAIPSDRLPLISGINNSNTVVGTVFPINPSSDRQEATVALWTIGGSRLSNLGGLTQTRSVGINNAGQVLIHDDELSTFRPRPLATYLWQNEVLTPVAGDMAKDQDVLGTAINDSGTVVGCLYNDKPLSRAVYTPFIWRNGVMENLSAYLAGKGAKLPAGTALGCPYAINNGGTILAYTYLISNESSTTWVRFNAKP